MTDFASMLKRLIMKNLLFLIASIIFCMSCQKVDFDINHPDVGTFVNKLKNGTYDYYKKGENGENLWLMMPKFTKDDIQALIDLSKDTSHITGFPANPASSMPVFPLDRHYYILGECLLWIVEGIRNDTGFGSLNPYVINTTSTLNYKALKGSKVLVIREFYIGWWGNYKDYGWKDKNPLEGTLYRWL